MYFYLTVSLVLALAASTSADGLGGLVYAPAYSLNAHSIPRYAFEYSVKDPSTGDNKAQWERREGDGVKGSYSLVEPGGGIRTVDYWADGKSGFNAIIRRAGPKVHPPTIRVAPIVKAPIFTSPVAPLHIGHVAPIAPLAAAPIYGALSTASIAKVSLPGPALPLPLPVAPVIAAPAIAPYAKTLLPGPLMPLPLMPNYLHSMGSLGIMNKLI